MRQTSLFYDNVYWHSWFLSAQKSVKDWYNNKYFIRVILTRKSGGYLTSRAVKMAYVNRPPLTIISANPKSFAKYNKLMPHTTGLYRVLEARYHVLIIVKNVIASTITINRASLVGSQYRQRLLTSNKCRRHTKNVHKERYY